MWCWRRMEKISWTDRVNNEAVIHRVKEEGNTLHTIRRRKANWIGHILRRNCLLSPIIEGKIRGTRKRGRRRKQLLDDLKQARRYWKLKEEAQDRTLRRTQFGREYGPVARETTTQPLLFHVLLSLLEDMFHRTHIRHHSWHNGRYKEREERKTSEHLREMSHLLDKERQSAHERNPHRHF
jgi:hypothetical protein